MSNERFQNAILRTPQKVPPIWFMRQAGRYHKHYQNLKLKYDFMQLCKEPELAAEVAMGPMEDFDFDVAILFSDLLFPLEVLGMGLRYDPGPILDRELVEGDLKNLCSIEEAVEGLQFQKKAMQITRQKLPKDKSLIGFVGGPWTLFTYATSGGHDGHLIKAKSSLPFYQQYLEIMLPLLTANIQLQLDGGAEVVMILDTAAGELSPQIFNDYVAEGLNHLANKFKGRLAYYSKTTTKDHLTEKIFSNSNWAGYGVDHRHSLSQILLENKSGFTQGNFDQTLLFLPPSEFEVRLHEWLRPMQALTLEQRKGWVCGLGHGILPKTPEENVRSFVRIVREELLK